MNLSDETETGSAETETGSEEQTKGSTRPVLGEYTDVFEGLGCLAGNYRIEIDPTVKPVVHPPRRVPCALREDVKDELTRMVGDGIMAPATEPTLWVSSMIAVKKKNNKLRICLDPRDLNKAIQRSHHPLPTLEDVATRLKLTTPKCYPC